MVSILAMHGAAKFDSVDEIHIRVGGLPQDPQPPLNYQLVFSVEGLINEYIEVARVIRQGKITTVESMTEIESPASTPAGTLSSPYTVVPGAATAVPTVIGPPSAWIERSFARLSPDKAKQPTRQTS